jgi:hypothetical protein
MTITIHLALLHAWIRDVQLRAYLARQSAIGGPYATDAYRWLQRWHEERGIPFAVPQRVCSEWMRGQGLLGTKHATMYNVIGRSSNKGQQRCAEREARDRRRQMRAERRQSV